MAKQYTAAQWARIQAALPEGDRIPYENSPEEKAPEPEKTAAEKAADLKTAREKAAAEAAAARAASDPMLDPTNRPQAPAPDDKYIYYYGWIGGAASGSWKLYRTPIGSSMADSATARSEGGKTQASVSSAVGANVLAGSGSTGKNTTGSTTGSTTSSTTSSTTGSTTSSTTSSTTGSTTTKKEVSRIYYGSGINRTVRITYDDGSFVDIPAPETAGTGATGSDTATQEFLKTLQEQNAALMAQLAAAQQQAAADAKAAAEAAAKEKRENAIAVLTDRFSRYGLASLIPKIKELAISGANEATITLQLQESEEYRQRFKANQDRIKKGLRVLDPGDYLALEDDYRQILRAYGLKQFDNDNYVTQFIANDISTTELSNRVVTAVQRVQNADPAILTTLRSYYGISDNDLVAYVLDPNQQFQKIERQVASAEIGAAAGIQGIMPGVAVAEQLAAQGVTKAQAQKGYATIADILPTAEKLSDIYGTTLDEYRLKEAEQEVFNTLASAQRKRQKLAEREVAAFSGTSGLGKGSLTSQIGGTI